MTRSYLDHASTSPIRPCARDAMQEVLAATSSGLLGDPARLHAEGISARDTLEGARESVAHWLGVRPRQVVFTSGATESIATASWTAWREPSAPKHVVGSAVEHSAVRAWAARGPHTEVPVDRHGLVDPERLVDATRPDTALVHLQWANHEVATRQPVEQVAELLAGGVDLRDSSRSARRSGTPVPAAGAPHVALLHTDAAQAGAAAPQAVASGADLVSLSGHKLGGPAGIGVLVVRRNLRIGPLFVGGDQERARRAGMENVAAAVGLAAVAEELSSSGDEETRRLAALGDRLVDWAERADGIQLLGHPGRRAPHLVCLALEGLEPQPVLLGLDQRGVAAHSGSSCSSEAFEPSPVLEAMGVDAQRSLRLSVGWSTTQADVDAAISALEEVLADLRSMRVRR